MRHTIVPDDPRGRAVAAGVRAAGVLSRPARFKGLYRAAKHLGRMVPPGQRCWVEPEAGSRFCFDLSDPYWSRLLADGYVYEPEIEHMFRLFRDRGFLFLDCGANYGYWSVYATGRTVSGPEARAKGGGCRAAVAVEAWGPNYARLEETAAANGCRFATLHRAVLDADGRSVEVGSDAPHHASRSLALSAEAGEPEQGSRVDSIGLDSLLAIAERNAGPAAGADEPLVVVKLDVEGVEEQALRGAEAIWKRELLIIYEDHFKDGDHTSTRVLLESLGMSVFHVGDSGEVSEVLEPRALDAIKTQRGRGYNFAAVRPDTPIAARFRAAVRG